MNASMNTSMNTIMFIEKIDDKGKMNVGFTLCKHNLYRAPKGQIRIARFEACFNPTFGHGYYGDIYMKLFIKKWKLITLNNKKRNFEKLIANIILKNKICSDLSRYIIEYI